MTESPMLDYQLYLDQLNNLPDQCETLEILDGNAEYLSRYLQGQSKVLAKWASRYHREEGMKGVRRLAELLARGKTGKYAPSTLYRYALAHDKYSELIKEFETFNFTYFLRASNYDLSPQDLKKYLEQAEVEKLDTRDFETLVSGGKIEKPEFHACEKCGKVHQVGGQHR